MRMRASVFLVGFLLISSGCLGQGDDLEFLGIEYRDPPEAPISHYLIRMEMSLS